MLTRVVSDRGIRQCEGVAGEDEGGGATGEICGFVFCDRSIRRAEDVGWGCGGLWWGAWRSRKGAFSLWRTGEGDGNSPELQLEEFLLVFNFKGTEVQF